MKQLEKEEVSEGFTESQNPGKQLALSFQLSLLTFLAKLEEKLLLWVNVSW